MGPRLTYWNDAKSDLADQLIDYLGFRASQPVQSKPHLGFLPDELPIARVGRLSSREQGPRLHGSGGRVLASKGLDCASREVDSCE